MEKISCHQCGEEFPIDKRTSCACFRNRDASYRLLATTCSPRVGDCPLEQRIAKALDTAGIRYCTDHEGGVPEALDFFLPNFGVHIEIKGGHSERIAGQMARSKNVIVAQGSTAVELLAAMIESLPNV